MRAERGNGQDSPPPVAVAVPVVAKHESRLDGARTQYTGGGGIVYDGSSTPATSTRGSRKRGGSWTAEAVSYLCAIAALAGLVATLLVHQNKPLPQWPQLVTINSIISLFSLVMRAGVGVVLAEGLSQCKWDWYRKASKLDHIERLDSASRGSWGSFTLLLHFKPTRA